MKTIISGLVTAKDLDDAGLMAGIFPTSLLTNAVGPIHASVLTKHSLMTYPICLMQPAETAEIARDYTLVQAGEALVCKGRNDHLVNLAKQYGLPVYEV